MEQLKMENIHLHEEYVAKTQIKLNAYEIELTKLQGENIKNQALLQ